MKYMLLIYQNPADLGDPVRGGAQRGDRPRHDELMEELTQSGELVGGEALADPSNTKTVRVRGGVPAITDGPYVEAKELLAGYSIVECETAGTGDRDRRPLAGCAVLGDGGAADDGAGRRGDVSTAPAVEDLLRELRAAGPRRARPSLRALRRVRGRGTGGAAGRRRAVARRKACRSNPRGWLITVASRRLTDGCGAIERAGGGGRERTIAGLVATGTSSSSPTEDDTLTLLFLCCHPALSPASQVALTLRAVGGLTTAQIASAFLVPEATMAQRDQPGQAADQGDRHPVRAAGRARARPTGCGVVLHVLYLIFNEGYTATSGPHLHRTDLTGEAIRLTPRRAPAAARRTARSPGCSR